jgi:5'-nucleotidase
VTADRKQDGGYSFSAETLPASSPEIELINPDPAMREAMGALKAELDKELGVVVMNAPFDLDGARERVRSSSTNLGRIVCAALVNATGADAALLNGGSFRDSIPKGDVTKGHFLSVLPYGNYVYLIEITGADLLAILNHGLGMPGAGGFPQFWGMEVMAKKREVTAADGTKSEIFEAASVTVGGKPLDPAATYTLATNDFLYAGGDGYEMFKKYNYREYATLEEVFRDYMAESDAAELASVYGADVLRVTDWKEICGD